MKLENLTGEQKISHVRKVTREAEQSLLDKHPLLRYQDAIGLSIFTLSITGIFISAWLYFIAAIPAWACVISSAIFTSFLHELEHDLIHYMYFKKNKLMSSVMMVGVWLFRGNIINPWVRRKIHLHHHKVSGSVDDTEERIIGNGMPHGWVRSMIMLDASLSGSIFSRHFRDLKTYSTRYVNFIGGLPMGFIFYALWGNFLGFHLFRLLLQHKLV